MIKVGINGYGTIGKRVAEAVTLQNDMKIVGIELIFVGLHCPLTVLMEKNSSNAKKQLILPALIQLH